MIMNIQQEAEKWADLQNYPVNDLEYPTSLKGIRRQSNIDAFIAGVLFSKQHYPQPLLRFVPVTERLPDDNGHYTVKLKYQPSGDIINFQMGFYKGKWAPPLHQIDDIKNGEIEVISWLDESSSPVVGEPNLMRFPAPSEQSKRDGWNYDYYWLDKVAELASSFDEDESISSEQVQYVLDALKSMAPVVGGEDDKGDGWIYDKWPPLIDGKDYSENVLAEVEGYKEVQVMTLCWVTGSTYEESGYVWANCFGDINGESEMDDDYKVIRWRSIPKL